MDKTLKELKENPDVKGTIPAQIQFGDVVIKAKSWQNIYQTTVHYFFEKDPEYFEEVVFSDRFKTSSKKPILTKNGNAPGEKLMCVGNGIYLRGIQMARQICTDRFPELLSAFGYNPDDAIITLEKKVVHETEEKTQALSQITGDMKFSDLISFKFQGTEHRVKSWPKMYVEVCRLLFAMDEQKFEQSVLCSFHDVGKIILFSHNKAEFGYYAELIGAGIYADTNCDVNHHILRLKAVLAVLGIPADDLVLTSKVVKESR